MWLDSELYPEAPYHNLVLTVELTGELDQARFAEAFSALVEAHDALRSAVCLEGSEPALRVSPEFATQLQAVALNLDEPAYTAWFHELIAKPLRPSAPNVAILARLSSARHVFILMQHHVVSDGQSLVNLCEELAHRYSGRSVEPAPSLLEYAEWERRYRESDKRRRDAEYWSKQLAGGVGSGDLYGIARTSTSVGLRHVVRPLGQELHAALASAAGAPPFKLATPELSRLALLLTGLFTYMYRVTGNRRLAVGVPIRNRPNRFRNTAGAFLEQPQVVVNIDEGETVASLAEKVRRTLFDAFRHGQYSVSDRGVFYATLNFHPSIRAEFTGLSCTARMGAAPMRFGRAIAARGDMRDTVGWVVYEHEDERGMELSLELHAETFAESQHALALDHAHNLLEAVVRDPGAKLDDLPMTSPAERVALTRHEAQTRRAYDRGARIQQLFEQAVDRSPEAVAVCFREESLSYRELDARANQLAHLLRSRGVGSDVLVGVCMQRSTELIVSLLAVIKAGGAYVPLDPAYPQDRIAHMLEDSKAPLVLVDRASQAALGDSPVARLVYEDLTAELKAAPRTRPDAPGNPSDCMYVIYTSGSTGKPKGVVIEHRNVVNFMAGMEDAGVFDRPQGVWLAGTSICFDISVLEIFGSLTHGYTLVVLGAAQLGVAADEDYTIAKAVERHKVTHFQCTPSQASILLTEDAARRALGRLELMMVGGEALALDLAAQLRSALAGGKLMNMYGPTETTIWSSTHLVEGDEARIPLGEPIANTQLYVLGPNLELLPFGVHGELCIGGDGVVRGYLNRPELTSERFVPNPWIPGGRMYRTGDLARYRLDGTLEFLGRNDFQVKIRGYRIELGEVEIALRGHPGVHESVVVARDDRGGVKRLVAYVTPRPGAQLAAKELKAHVGETLAEYMVPSDIVILDALPLTSNGKVDRKALPAPPMDAALAEEARHERDLSDHEARVAALWSELLDRPAVGVDDDFFALGGDSLLATRLRERLRQEFGVELPLLALFEAPTVAGMTSALENRLPEAPLPYVIPLRHSRSGKAPLFCLLGIALYRSLAMSLKTDRPVYGVHVPYMVPTNTDHPSELAEIARRYVYAIREVCPRGPYHLSGLCFGGIVAFEVARQLHELGERVESILLFDAMLPRAIRVRRDLQIAHYAREALRRPERVREWLTTAREKALDSLRARAARLRPALDPSRELSQPKELDVLSLEADVLVHGYQGSMQPAVAPTVLFRATGAERHIWERIDENLGWAPFVPGLRRVDVHCGHLALMREPHVTALAALIDGLPA